MKNEVSILQANQLTIGYRDRKHVKAIASDIEIDLKQGKLIALIGANGIGKSTLLRTITGIQPPLAGSIRIDGENLGQLSSLALARKLSVVLTDSLPPSNLTVFELVALGRQPYTNWIGTLSSVDIEKINDALDLVQIADLKHKKHFEISDGQLQKVLIARALAQDTPLIILDEPTTHLDLLHKATLFLLLKRLTQETNKTILFSTHDLEIAIQLSDEMIVMTNGKIIQQSPENLIAENVFDSLFPEETIAFDTIQGKFIFKNL